MPGRSIAFYRLPTRRAAHIGSVRVVIDRNGRIYMAGSPVVNTEPSGDFLIVTLANGETYYVKSKEYERLRPGGPARS